jgi:thioredoxin 1
MTSENLHKAIGLLRAGDKRAAQESFMAVIESDPNCADAWVGISFCVSNPDQARLCLKRAVRLDPNHAYARQALARLDEARTARAQAPRQVETLAPQEEATPKKGGWGWVAVFSSFFFLCVVVVGGLAALSMLQQAQASPPGRSLVAQTTPAVQKVAQTGGPYTFVDFYADWCGPCQQMRPVVESLQRNCSANVTFVYLDIDDPVNAEWVKYYRVNAIPRYVVLNAQGNVVHDWVGSGPASRFDPVARYCSGY